MKIPLFNKKIKSKNHQNNSNHYADYLNDQNYGLYVEDYFAKMLCNERKRTERSKRPFLVMFINIEEILEIDKKDEVVQRITSVLFSATRDTDIKGWHKHDSVIGVIFTELNGVDKNLVKKKLYNNISSILDSEQSKKVRITFHIFPEENGDTDNGNSKSKSDFDPYNDPSKQTISKRTTRILKRSIDIVGSIMGLIIFLPFFIIVPLLIKLTSSGPILYRQERIGMQGERFTFLKFRSMHVNNDSAIHKDYINKLIDGQIGQDIKKSGREPETLYKIKDDPRITSLGNFLRKTSIDEIPQFFNVLKGDMSLVGPRPPIPYELERYDIWHRRRVLEIKPGITGLWQINGRSKTTFDEMVRMDIQYSIQWSLWLDIMILIQTPVVVLTGKGAY